jgi:phosphoglucosamine mutase
MAIRRYFGTDGIRGVAGEAPMTAAFALNLGVAAAETMRRSAGQHPHVLVGMDTRRSGPMLAHSAAAGLTSRGARVTWLGVIPTPGVSYLTRSLGADAGLMVSASHNPFHDNGLKLFDSDGEKLPDAREAVLEELLEALAQGELDHLTPVTGADVGSVEEGSAGPLGAGSPIDPYFKHLLDNAPYLDGLRVALDCAHGAAYAIAPQLFNKIGARLDVINVTPDGHNINVQCGSTHPEAVRQKVLTGGFDVGVTFDGDADRALLVDARGRLVTGDHIMAITALSRGESQVVATQMTNLGTEKYLQQHGVALHRTKVGDRYVFEELRTRGLTLGGEQSGHLLFLDKAPTGDGMLTALMLLSAVRKSGRPLEQWMDEIPVYPQLLVNVTVPLELRDGLSAEPAIVAAAERAELELGDSGRLLLRPSGTEPLVRVMVEGQDHDLVERVANEVAQVVRDVAGISSAPVR